MKEHGNLVILKRNGSDYTSFPLQRNACTIGRSAECDIRVQLPSISKTQCQINVDASGKAYLTNLSSANPTALNDYVLGYEEAVVLMHEDTIHMSDRLFRWEYPQKSHYAEAIRVSNSRKSGSSKNKRFNTSDSEAMRSKNVSFGPYLSPEHFDKKLPASTPIKKGDKPYDLDDIQIKTPKTVHSTPIANESRGLLRRRSPTPIKPSVAKALGLKGPKVSPSVKQKRLSAVAKKNESVTPSPKKRVITPSKEATSPTKRHHSQSPMNAKKENLNQKSEVQSWVETARRGIVAKGVTQRSPQKIEFKMKQRKKVLPQIAMKNMNMPLYFGINSTGHVNSPAPIIIRRRQTKTPMKPRYVINKKSSPKNNSPNLDGIEKLYKSPKMEVISPMRQNADGSPRALKSPKNSPKVPKLAKVSPNTPKSVKAAPKRKSFSNSQLNTRSSMFEELTEVLPQILRSNASPKSPKSAKTSQQGSQSSLKLPNVKTPKLTSASPKTPNSIKVSPKTPISTRVSTKTLESFKLEPTTGSISKSLNMSSLSGEGDLFLTTANLEKPSRSSRTKKQLSLSTGKLMTKIQTPIAAPFLIHKLMVKSPLSERTSLGTTVTSKYRLKYASQKGRPRAKSLGVSKTQDLYIVSMKTPKSAKISAQNQNSTEITPNTPKLTKISPNTPKSAKISAKTPKSTKISPKTPKSTKISEKTPKSSKISPKTTKSSKISPKTTKSSKISPNTPKSAKTPKSNNIFPKAPKSNKVSPKTPKSTQISQRTPKSAKISYDTPKSNNIVSKTLKSTKISPKTPKSTKISPKTPKSTKIAPKTPKSATISPKTPKSTRISRETPKPTKISSKTLKSNTISPKAPKSSKISPETPKSATISSKTPKSIKISARTPKSVKVGRHSKSKTSLTPSSSRQTSLSNEKIFAKIQTSTSPKQIEVNLPAGNLASSKYRQKYGSHKKETIIVRAKSLEGNKSPKPYRKARKSLGNNVILEMLNTGGALQKSKLYSSNNSFSSLSSHGSAILPNTSFSTPSPKTPPSGRKSRASVPINSASSHKSGTRLQKLNNNSITFDFSNIRTPEITADKFISPLGSSKFNATIPERIRNMQNESPDLFSTPANQLFGKAGQKIRLAFSNNIRKDILKMQNKYKTRHSVSSYFDDESQKLSSTPRCSDVQAEKLFSKNISNISEALYTQDSTIGDISHYSESSNVLKENMPMKNLSKATKKIKIKTLKKVKASPCNYTDVKGIKKLMKTPRPTKSPVSDYSNIAGVRRLMKTPVRVISPSADYSNVKGMKKLLKTPKPKNSPLSDYTNVKGIKKLLKTPKPKNSPLADYTNVKGIKKLLKTPKPTDSPLADYTDVKGLKRLLRTPKTHIIPLADYTNVSGLKKLLAVSKRQSYISLHDDELKNLFNVDESNTHSDNISYSKCVYAIPDILDSSSKRSYKNKKIDSLLCSEKRITRGRRVDNGTETPVSTRKTPNKKDDQQHEESSVSTPMHSLSSEKPVSRRGRPKKNIESTPSESNNKSTPDNSTEQMASPESKHARTTKRKLVETKIGSPRPTRRGRRKVEETDVVEVVANKIEEQRPTRRGRKKLETIDVDAQNITSSKFVTSSDDIVEPKPTRRGRKKLEVLKVDEGKGIPGKNVADLVEIPELKSNKRGRKKLPAFSLDTQDKVAEEIQPKSAKRVRRKVEVDKPTDSVDNTVTIEVVPTKPRRGRRKLEEDEKQAIPDKTESPERVELKPSRRGRKKLQESEASEKVTQVKPVAEPVETPEVKATRRGRKPLEATPENSPRKRGPKGKKVGDEDTPKKGSRVPFEEEIVQPEVAKRGKRKVEDTETITDLPPKRARRGKKTEIAEDNIKPTKRGQQTIDSPVHSPTEPKRRGRQAKKIASPKVKSQLVTQRVTRSRKE